MPRRRIFRVVDDDDDDDDFYFDDDSSGSIVEMESDSNSEDDSDASVSSMQLLARENDAFEIERVIRTMDAPSDDSTRRQTATLLSRNNDTTSTASVASSSKAAEIPITSTCTALTQSSEDAYTCPVCFEPWTNSDTHRLVSLRCGHLFGKSCVVKWLKDKPANKRRCPQCNTSAKVSDIRNLYARTVKAIDTEEVQVLKRKYEEEVESRLKIQAKSNELEMKLAFSLSENERLKEELMNMKRYPSNRVDVVAAVNRAVVSKKKAQPFTKVSSIEISAKGGCRVLSSSNIFGLVISQPSTVPIFPGFGVRKVTNELKAHDFIHLHQSDIKDIELHAYDSLLLTSSVDKTVKAASLVCNNKVFEIELECGGWSVCWDKKNHDRFFVGLQNGNIVQYDIRNTKKEFKRISAFQQPICSLHYCEINNNIPVNGLLATHLSRCYFHRSDETGNYTSTLVPVNGSFLSSHFDRKSSNILFSRRPSGNEKRISHMLMSFTDFTPLKTTISATFFGGQKAAQMSRSKIMPHPENVFSSLICASDHSVNGAIIWDVNNKTEYTLKGSDPVFDLAMLESGNTSVLTTLTERSLISYKWNS